MTRYRYEKGDRVIRRTGDGPQGTVLRHKITCFGTVDCQVKWDDGIILYCPTNGLRKVKKSEVNHA